MAENIRERNAMTVGIDLGDKYSHVCVLDAEGEVVERSRIRTSERGFRRFTQMESCRIAFEVGTHSSWVRRLLAATGHEVLVANTRKVRLIHASGDKDDRIDAEHLARLARVDRRLLFPVRHRSGKVQVDRAVLRGRDGLVQCRTKLINQIRGLSKSMGAPIAGCSATSFHKRVMAQLPEALHPAVEPVLATIADLTRRIREYDRRIDRMCEHDYPETALLRQVTGVGALTSLGFVLTIEDPKRFRDSRRVGAYAGLRPRRHQSGASDPELRISKTGDAYLRRLLVGSAQYILGPFGSDSDLRRWGLDLAARGGKNAKKRAVVAVARKLAVLLHRLWVTAEEYEPLRNSERPMRSESRHSIAV
jgi:transposase